eukprot:7606654-Pyramimonas_sp.AAC.1
MDTAAHADEGSRARQSVRNILRKRPALTSDVEKAYLKSAPATDNLRRPKFEHREHVRYLSGRQQPSVTNHSIM